MSNCHTGTSIIPCSPCSHGAEQRSPCLCVALEPDAKFEIDVSVAANRVCTGKSISNLAKVIKWRRRRQTLGICTALHSLVVFQMHQKPVHLSLENPRGSESTQGRERAKCSRAKRCRPEPVGRCLRRVSHGNTVSAACQKMVCCASGNQGELENLNEIDQVVWSVQH